MYQTDFDHYFVNDIFTLLSNENAFEERKKDFNQIVEKIVKYHINFKNDPLCSNNKVRKYIIFFVFTNL